jgi:hypothetical protein
MVSGEMCYQTKLYVGCVNLDCVVDSSSRRLRIVDTAAAGGWLSVFIRMIDLVHALQMTDYV